MASAVAAAVMPLERLAVVKQYAREAQARKAAIEPGFVAAIIEGLAQQARDFAVRRPADALAAALALNAAAALGLPKPAAAYPSAKDILAATANPAAAVAELAEPSLWPAALDALEHRPDAGDHLEALLRLASAGQLDEIARRLAAAGRQEALNAAVAAAVAEPLKGLDLCLWLWKGPSRPCRSGRARWSCSRGCFRRYTTSTTTGRPTPRSSRTSARSSARPCPPATTAPTSRPWARWTRPSPAPSSGSSSGPTAWP